MTDKENLEELKQSLIRYINNTHKDNIEDLKQIFISYINTTDELIKKCIVELEENQNFLRQAIKEIERIYQVSSIH